MITHYDLASKNNIKTWSPNPWKTRYVLNYKKLAYESVYLEYPDIEDELKKRGIPPSEDKPDGSGPLYTSPSIFDHETNTVVTDSYKIAQYLDKTYPSTPRVFPPGTEAFQAAFYEHFHKLMEPVVPFFLPRLPPDIMNPPSAEYYARTRSAWFGMPLADMEPKGAARIEAWKKSKESFDKLYGWLMMSHGPYFAGEVVTFSDFVVAGMLQCIKLCLGEESKEWKDIESWHEGSWKKFLENLSPYADVEH